MTNTHEPIRQVTVPAPARWINSNQRLHRMQTAKLTAAWREAARAAVPAAWGAWDVPVRVVAEVWKARAGRYDPGNLYPTAKACVDGFTDAGLWVDDDHAHLVGPDMRHGGKGEPCLVFTITEARQDSLPGVVEKATTSR